MSGTPNGYVHLQDVVKAFPAPGGQVEVLKGINLSVRQGEYVSIVGKSGSGKSTLLNMITGIDHPTRGVVEVAGVRLHTLSENQLAAWRGVTIGIVFQFFQLLPMLSLLENTLLPMDLCNRYSPAEREARARSLLEQVGLAEVMDKLPGAVSGGQQQAAAIARALANDPPLIVADEPTGNLDERTAADVLALFDGLVAQGKTVIIVTHDPALMARTQRTILLSDGEIINPHLASALGWLTHPQLLQLTHLARPRRFEAGQTLARPGETIGLWVLVSGRVGLFKAGPPAEQQPAEFSPGQWWSGETLAETAPDFSLRALESGEALVIEAAAWREWLQTSGLLAAFLKHYPGGRAEP
jgi:putative ABC transport system ATP-binding protein